MDYLIGLSEEPKSAKAQPAPTDLRLFLDQQQVMFNGIPLSETDKRRIMDILTGLFYDSMRR